MGNVREEDSEDVWLSSELMMYFYSLCLEIPDYFLKC